MNVETIKNALAEFLQEDVQALQLELTSNESNVWTFAGVDVERDNAPTVYTVEQSTALYSVEMLINGSMQNIGGFNL